MYKSAISGRFRRPRIILTYKISRERLDFLSVAILMSYISSLKLIHSIVTGKKTDAREILSEVDRHRIEQSLKRSKDGLPEVPIFTNEPIEEENLSRIPFQDKQRLWGIYDRLTKPGERSTRELPALMELRKKHPNVPAIYNYITIAYANMGQHDDYYQTIIDTYRKFPGYLFGMISAAEYCLNNDRHKEVPAIFGNKLEIAMHYPGVCKVFHISEVRSFYSIVGRYYSRNRKAARAIFYYFIINEIAPDHWATKKLADEIILMEVRGLKKKLNRS